MRRFVLSATAGLMLSVAAVRPVPAQTTGVVKEFMDCMIFTSIWCDFAREDVNNWLEEWAVEFVCSLTPYGCFVKAVL